MLSAPPPAQDFNRSRSSSISTDQVLELMVVESDSEVLEMETEPTAESKVKNVEVQATPHKRNVRIQTRIKHSTRGWFYYYLAP